MKLPLLVGLCCMITSCYSFSSPMVAPWSHSLRQIQGISAVGMSNAKNTRHGTKALHTRHCPAIRYGGLTLVRMVDDGNTAPMGNILVLDHVNINHKKGRHDLLKAFYFDVLGCACDPRKEENLEKGKKTLWANSGINQFHLPEDDEAQLFAGTLVLHYSSLHPIRTRLASPPAILSGTLFSWKDSQEGGLRVTCPWGNVFELKGDSSYSRDARGSQPGASSEPLGMPELRVDVPFGSNMAGIQRFYEDVMKAPVDTGPGSVTVHCGAGQKMVFQEKAKGENVVHSDYHISMYISDLPGTFQRAEELGLVFVNPRFKRQAHNLEEAVDQCMFRVKDLVDPLNVVAGPIIELEHEIRSAITKDGKPYKSCPFTI